MAVREHVDPLPIFSIRDAAGDPVHESYRELGPVCTLPQSFDAIIAEDREFRRAARALQKDLIRLWGDESEKHRLYEALWLQRECDRLGIGHLHTHFVGIGARTAFWLSRIGGPTFSVTAHANDIFRDESPGRLSEILGAAAAVVTVSHFSKNHLESTFPHLAGRLFRVYNGIDLDAFPPAHPAPDTPPLILSVGRAIEKKGFPDLISACSRLADRPFRCRIIGGGPLEETLRQQVQDLGLTSVVEICGPRLESEIISALTQSSLFVLPCVTGHDGAIDNLPTVIMEAMACALPVVSTSLAGIPEMVRNGETGWLVPERQPDALAKAIASLLDHPEKAKEMGKNGLHRCREMFSIQSTSACLLNALKSCGVSIPTTT